MAVTVPLRLSSARPEPTRLEENLGPCIEEKVYILGCLPVLPDCVRDVRRNVLFQPPTKNIDDPAVRIDNLLWRRLCTGIRRLPSVHGAAPSHLCSFRPRAVHCPEAIHEQRASCFRPSVGVKRQQIDFRVPEDMPVIVVAGEPTRSDGNSLIRRIGGAVEVIDSETQRLLGGRVSADLEIAGMPPVCPNRLVLFDDLAPADLSGHAELVPCNTARICILGVASDRNDQPREARDLPWTRLPMPGPRERTKRGWHNLGAVDLQRRCSSDRETFARILGPPHPEIPL